MAHDMNSFKKGCVIFGTTKLQQLKGKKTMAMHRFRHHMHKVQAVPTLFKGPLFQLKRDKNVTSTPHLFGVLYNVES